jgi:hypothetical protein
MSYNMPTADFVEVVFRDHKLHPSITHNTRHPGPALCVRVPPWELPKAESLAHQIEMYRGVEIAVLPKKRRERT